MAENIYVNVAVKTTLRLTFAVVGGAFLGTLLALALWSLIHG